MSDNEDSAEPTTDDGVAPGLVRPEQSPEPSTDYDKAPGLQGYEPGIQCDSSVLHVIAAKRQRRPGRPAVSNSACNIRRRANRAALAEAGPSIK